MFAILLLAVFVGGYAVFGTADAVVSRAPREYRPPEWHAPYVPPWDDSTAAQYCIDSNGRGKLCREAP